MKLNKNNFVMLSDNMNYLVVSNVIYEDKDYYLLVDINNYSNIKFVVINNNEVFEIKDRKILNKILNLVIKDMKL